MKKYPHTIPLCYKLDTTMSQFILTFQRSKPGKQDRSMFAQTLINEANTIQENYFVMANTKRKVQNYSNFTTKFANIALDSEQKEILKGWLKANAKDLDTFFHDMVTNGWKTSCTWDDANDCFLASATQRLEDDRNYDVCVTSRSDNLYEAILITYYKIYVLFDGNRLPIEPTKQNWG